MKSEKVKVFLSSIPDQLSKLKRFLSQHGTEVTEFAFSFDEIDSIGKCVKHNYKKDEKILDSFRVYLGEAVIVWGGGKWTYYEPSSPPPIY
jgi:hypothetical protein